MPDSLFQALRLAGLLPRARGGNVPRDGLPLRPNRPRWFVQDSIRGLLDVMPAQDVSFRGIAFGWKGIGLVDFGKKRGDSKVGRFKRVSGDGVGLAGEPPEGGLGQSLLDVAGDSLEAANSLVVVSGGDVNDDLNVGAEPGERLLGHAHTVQPAVSMSRGMNGVSDET